MTGALLRIATLAVAVPALFSSLAQAHEFKAGDLELIHPWTRATPGGAQVAGGYMTVINHGSAPEHLVGGSLEGAATAQLHRMTTENGVMKMRPADPIEIAPGASVTLSPSGDHMMFGGLSHGLKQGQKVDGTFVFEHAGTVPVVFAVEAIGAKAPAGAPKPDKSGHSMPGMTME